MRKEATLLMANGDSHIIKPKNGTDFKLKEVQELVGVTVDVQRLPTTEQILIIDDNGKLDNRPINIEATRLWKKHYPIEQYPDNNDQLIVGDVIHCDSDMFR